MLRRRLFRDTNNGNQRNRQLARFISLSFMRGQLLADNEFDDAFESDALTCESTFSQRR